MLLTLFHGLRPDTLQIEIRFPEKLYFFLANLLRYYAMLQAKTTHSADYRSGGDVPSTNYGTCVAIKVEHAGRL
jgi:hypothetical protein